MASISRRLFSHTRRYPSRISVQCTPSRYTPQWQRPLSTTPHRRADEPTKEDSVTPTGVAPPSKAAEEVKEASKEAADVQPQEPVALNATTGAPSYPPILMGLDRLVEDLGNIDDDVIEAAIRAGRQGIPLVKNDELDEEDGDIDETTEKGFSKPGFWSEGEESLGPDEDYYADDITSTAHGQLEQHRELREYARLIAWELPLLSQLAQPWVPPTAATPFRFRYTSYLGERHPAINKVVVEFTAKDMELSPIQRDKLIKLAGVRYNPDTDVIKMSCEKFDTQTQNKRFLGETITKLLAEAKDGTDTFADVPFDFRHHKPKVRHQFPQEWILTPERKKYLEEKRAQSAKLDGEKMFNNAIIDGQRIVQTSLPYTVPEPEPVMVNAPRGRAGR